jgi:hypothetical protein
MTPAEWITAGKDVLLGLAAATTAIVAVVGLSKWRQELHGKAHFDTARGLIRATYKLRDELRLCRSPFYLGQEFPPNYDSLRERTREKEAKAWAHVYKNRWMPVWGAIQEFDAQSLEGEALWGRSVRSKTEALRACAHELNVAMDAVIADKAEGGENFRADPEFGRRMRATVAASGGDEKNELSQKMSQAITDIEDEVRPHLRRSSPKEVAPSD